MRRGALAQLGSLVVYAVVSHRKGEGKKKNVNAFGKMENGVTFLKRSDPSVQGKAIREVSPRTVRATTLVGCKCGE